MGHEGVSGRSDAPFTIKPCLEGVKKLKGGTNQGKKDLGVRSERTDAQLARTASSRVRGFARTPLHFHKMPFIKPLLIGRMLSEALERERRGF